MNTAKDDLEKEGLVEAFSLNSGEIAEARENLLGFFETLYQIDQRIQQEKLAGKGGKNG